MSIEKQIDIINTAHNSEAIFSHYGKGIGRCSIHRWHATLAEYTVPKLPFPMIAIQTSGRAKIRRIDNKKTRSTDYVMPGDMTIIPQMIDINWAVNGLVDVICIIFENEDTCRRLMDIYNNNKHTTTDNIFVGSFNDSLIYSTSKHILFSLSETEDPPFNYITQFFLSLELYILNYLGKKDNSIIKSNSLSPPIIYAYKRLSLDVKNKINIESIAKELKITPSYLSRKFKEEVGTSPHDFLLLTRLKIARKLLAETELDIVSIAHESGFSSQSHLTRYFSKHFDVTPSKYRQHTKKC